MRIKTARILDKTVVLIGTLALAARTYQFPSQQFWDSLLQDRGWILIGLLLIVGFFAAFTPAEAISTRARAERSLTIRRQILNSFGRLLEIQLATTPQVGLDDLGLHVWRKRRTLRHPLSGVLARVATYRVGTNPVNRAFTPTKGVGVVGLCWKNDHEIAVDVEKIAIRARSAVDFEHLRTSEGGDAVMNLEWVDFERIRHRGAVFAYPIRNARSKFVGCVSVDASVGFAALDQPALRREMSLLSVVIGEAGFENV